MNTNADKLFAAEEKNKKLIEKLESVKVYLDGAPSLGIGCRQQVIDIEKFLEKINEENEPHIVSAELICSGETLNTCGSTITDRLRIENSEGKLIFVMKDDGGIIWNNREVESDDEFKNIMVEVGNLLISLIVNNGTYSKFTNEGVVYNTPSPHYKIMNNALVEADTLKPFPLYEPIFILRASYLESLEILEKIYGVDSNLKIISNKQDDATPALPEIVTLFKAFADNNPERMNFIRHYLYR